MASQSKASKQFVFLRKVFAGLVVVCFLVFIIGQSIVGVSPESMVFWSSLLVLVVGISAQVIIRLWRSWEDVNDGSRVTGPQESDLK